MNGTLTLEYQSHPEIAGAFWGRLVREDSHGGTPQTDWQICLTRDDLERWAGENFAVLRIDPAAGEDPQ